MWAAIQVLRGKRRLMTAAEIFTEIRERKLAPGLRGKTPEQTVAAQLAVAAKRGRHVERPEPGQVPAQEALDPQMQGLLRAIRAAA
jgi:hypothetical protein